MDNREFARLLLNEAAELLDVEPLNEAAKFTFFPQFKKMSEKYPELSEAKNIIAEGDKIMCEMGAVPSKSQIKSILKVLLKILKYAHSIGSALFLPFIILIAPIFPYVITRLVVYLEEYGYNALSQSELKDQMKAMKDMIDKTTDKKQKERLQGHYSRLSEIYSKLN